MTGGGGDGTTMTDGIQMTSGQIGDQMISGGMGEKSGMDEGVGAAAAAAGEGGSGRRTGPGRPTLGDKRLEDQFEALVKLATVKIEEARAKVLKKEAPVVSDDTSTAATADS